MQHSQLQASGIVEDQQIGGLRWQQGEDVWSGQRDKSLLELSGSQGGKGNGNCGLQNGRGEYRRHPRRKGCTDEGEDGPKGALRNRLDDGRGNEGRNFGVERLGWIKGEKVGEETSSVG